MIRFRSFRIVFVIPYIYTRVWKKKLLNLKKIASDSKFFPKKGKKKGGPRESEGTFPNGEIDRAGNSEDRADLIN